MTVLLVGEANPYSTDPEDALYHLPRTASGNRLREVLGMTDAEYLAKFTRRNLYAGRAPARWSLDDAADRAGELLEGLKPLAVVALGRKVSAAFCRTLMLPELGAFDAVTSVGTGWCTDGPLALLSLPHPSGLCREWDDPGARPRARSAVAKLVEWASGQEARRAR